MAATTPTSVWRSNIGEFTLHIVLFPATADDTNTWASGLGTSVVAYWAQGITDPTQTKEGLNVQNSSGTFTFSLPEDNISFYLFVISKS